MIHKRNQKIVDPFFGSMELVDDEYQYFGKGYFTPLQTEIEINIFPNQEVHPKTTFVI